MTNQEYAANLLVEAANILNTEQDVVSYGSMNEEAAYINDLSHRIDIMCEYAINVLPYETDTMTEGVGSVAKAAFEKLKKAAQVIWEKIKELYNRIKNFFKKIKGRRIARKEGKVPSVQSMNNVIKRVNDLLSEYKMNHGGAGASGRYDEETIKKINGELAAEMSRTEDYIKIAKGSEVPTYESQLDTLKTYAAQLNKLIASTNFNSRVAENHEARAASAASDRDRVSAENTKLSRNLEGQKGLSDMYLNASKMHNDRANKYFNESFDLKKQNKQLRDQIETLRIVNKAISEIGKATQLCLPASTDSKAPIVNRDSNEYDIEVRAPKADGSSTIIAKNHKYGSDNTVRTTHNSDGSKKVRITNDSGDYGIYSRSINYDKDGKRTGSAHYNSSNGEIVNISGPEKGEGTIYAPSKPARNKKDNLKNKKDAKRARREAKKRSQIAALHNSAVLESLYDSLALCESIEEVDAIMESIEAIENSILLESADYDDCGYDDYDDFD